MRLAFAGTPAFAVPTLDALRNAGHDICAIYTQPDRPAGRGRKPAASAVKQYGARHGLPVWQPATLRDETARLSASAPDALIVVAYGLLLPPAILSVPRHGCLNVHASILPRWRGAAPVARAIEAGDTDTGVSIMQMEAGLDTGPVLARAHMAIGAVDTAAALQDRLAARGAALLVETLTQLVAGTITPQPQDATQATYAHKLSKSEATVDWRQPATVVHRKIRAFNPWPVAQTTWRGELLRLWEVGPSALTATTDRPPGTVIDATDSGVRVATGDGAVTITRLQAAGGKALTAVEFLNGHRMSAGDRLGS